MPSATGMATPGACGGLPTLELGSQPIADHGWEATCTWAKKISTLEQLACRYYRWIHATRISLAFLITFAGIRWFKLEDASWALITMLIVMGPLPYWGNVFSRAVQRTGGTVIGAVSGLVALYLEMYSFPAMLLWCAVVMFACGYLTLGKHPYMALLIGATLAVVSCSAPNDMDAAVLRSVYVMAGSILALIYTSIYPQRAYTDLRIKFSQSMGKLNDLYEAYFSPQVLERPTWTTHSKMSWTRWSSCAVTSPPQATKATSSRTFSMACKRCTAMWSPH